MMRDNLRADVTPDPHDDDVLILYDIIPAPRHPPTPRAPPRRMHAAWMDVAGAAASSADTVSHCTVTVYRSANRDLHTQ